MSKNIRWSLYTAIIVGVMGFGYYLTFTQRPDSYMPQDLPAHMDENVDGDREGRRQDEADKKLRDSIDEESWTIEFDVVVDEVRLLQSDQDSHQYLALTIEHDFDAATTTEPAPTLDSPIRAIAPESMLDMTLDRRPEPGDRLTMTSQGTDDNPSYLTIQDLRFTDGD